MSNEQEPTVPENSAEKQPHLEWVSYRENQEKYNKDVLRLMNQWGQEEWAQAEAENRRPYINAGLSPEESFFVLNSVIMERGGDVELGMLGDKVVSVIGRLDQDISASEEFKEKYPDSFEDILYVFFLYLDSDHRGGNGAADLTQRMIELASERDLDHVDLSCDAEQQRNNQTYRDKWGGTVLESRSFPASELLAVPEFLESKKEEGVDFGGFTKDSDIPINRIRIPVDGIAQYLAGRNSR